MNKEIWKDISGYEGLYQVSNLGRVKSLNYLGHHKEAIKKPSLPKKTIMKPSQYYKVILYKNGKAKIFLFTDLSLKHSFLIQIITEQIIWNGAQQNIIVIINEITANPWESRDTLCTEHLFYIGVRTRRSRVCAFYPSVCVILPHACSLIILFQKCEQKLIHKKLKN